MKIIPIPPHEPSNRLQWITRHDHPPRELHGPRYLLIPALLAVLLLVVVLAIVIGSSAHEFFRLYTNWLQSLAAPQFGPQ